MGQAFLQVGRGWLVPPMPSTLTSRQPSSTTQRESVASSGSRSSKLPGELHCVRIALVRVADEFRGFILVTVDKSDIDRTLTSGVGRVAVADDMRVYSTSCLMEKSERTDLTCRARCVYKSACAGGMGMKRLCDIRRCRPRQREQT